MDNNIKEKNIILAIAVIFIGLGIAAGTYAYLTSTIVVTNGSYNTMTHCFAIDYNINNVDGTQDITGTLFPSALHSKGLMARVGLKVNNSCALTGLGTLKMHIDDSFTVIEDGSPVTKYTSELFGTIATSHCENMKDFEVMSTYTTEVTCEANNGKWVEIPTSYCENSKTLEVMEQYTTSNACTSNGGVWTTNGSSLKYVVYDTTEANVDPVAAGYFYSSDIGNDAVIYDNIPINSTQKYYYIYIWLDGYLTDNSYTELPFSGHISASALQNSTSNN